MSSPDLTTWTKVHDRFVETLVHLVRLRLERHVARHLGRSDAGDLDEAVAGHERQLGELEDELAAVGGPSAFRALAATAGLGDVEREAVVLALAAALDPGVPALLALVHDDPTRRHVTPALVAALGDRPLSEVWPLLDPVCPTQRFRIFAPAGGEAGVATRLALDLRMVNLLRGRNHLDARVAEVAALAPGLPLSAGHEQVVLALVDWLVGGERRGATTVNLVGPPGQGREAIAGRLGAELGMAALHVGVESLALRPDRGELLRLVEREALLLPALVYLDAPAAPDPAVETGLQEALATLGGLVVVGSDQPLAHRSVDHVAFVPALTTADRVELWRQVADGAAPGALASLAQQFPLGPEATARAASAARAASPADALGAGSLWTAARQVAGRDLGGLATRIVPSAGWPDLVLPDRELALLRSIADQVRLRATVYDDWGFGARLANGSGISALFAGPPGTGKSMAAEVLAAELELDLYRIDLSAVVSKWIGETEKNLRRLFDAAELGGALLLFDEADALFGKRSEVKDSHDRYANIEVDYLLQRMDGYRGLSILATNRKADLDPAFLRRIRFFVPFAFPRPELRRRIWAGAFPPGTPVEPLDHTALARLEVAGGSIRNIAVNAAFSAAAEGRAVTTADLMRMAGHEYRKSDRMISAAEFGDYAGLAGG